MNTNIKTAKMDTKISYYVTKPTACGKRLVIFFIITFTIMYGLGGLVWHFEAILKIYSVP